MKVTAPRKKTAPRGRKPEGRGGSISVPPGKSLPDVLQYTDYRKFLSDHYRARKAADTRYSLRVMAREAGLPSHGHLKFLMDGSRNLTQRTLLKLTLATGLDAARARHFENLVYFNQARTLKEKQVYYERLRESPAGAGFRKLGDSQLGIFRAWHLTAIREAIALKGFRADADWIGRNLLPRLDARTVREALGELSAAGLIRRVANGWKQADPDVGTDNEVRSMLVKGYHAEMLRLALRALDEIPAPERDISAVCFPVREADWPALKARLQALRKELRALEAKPGAGERLIQVNIQAFPLTRGAS